jgi:hypothetical protein
MEATQVKQEARAVKIFHADVGLKSSAVIRDANGATLTVTFTGLPASRAA